MFSPKNNNINSNNNKNNGEKVYNPGVEVLIEMTGVIMNMWVDRAFEVLMNLIKERSEIGEIE